MKLLKLLSLLVCVCLFTGAVAAEAGQEAEPAPEAAALKKGTAWVSLRGDFPLRPPVPLFSQVALSRSEGRELIKQAFDEGYQQVVIDCTRGTMLSAATAESFAAVIKTNKKEGHAVTCLIDNATDSTMILAAACDQTVCVEAGFSQIDGLALYMDYYAGALEKIGIKFHAVTSGPQKTGPEFITRTTPSEAALAQAQRLLDAIDKNVLALSERKDLSSAQIKQARELSPQTNKQMLDSGLADAVVEMLAWRAQLPHPIQTIKQKSNVPDMSSFAGMMQFWGQLMRGPQDRKAKAFIAVLELEGSIVDGGTEDPALITALKTVKVVKDLHEDERVKAVLIRINSGGGSATASDRIYHAIKRLAADKPCAVLIDDVAASGGYYIASAANRIFAHHSSITGSIGVFAMMPDMTAMRDMLGVNRHVLSSSGRATLMDSGAFGEQKRAAILEIIEDIDQRFQGIVATERKLEPAKVAALADGKVYLAAEALELGLVDELAGYDQALSWLLAKAGEPSLPVERFPEKQGLAEVLGLGLGTRMWMPATLRCLYHAAQLDRPQVYCWRMLPQLR